MRALDEMFALAEAGGGPVDGFGPECGCTPTIRTVWAITDRDELPELPPEVIEGVIRKGGKLLIAGASKAGKSYLLIELAVAVAEGGSWCDFQCAKGRVLYLNLEIQEQQFMHRVCHVVERADADARAVQENLEIANLRGRFSDAAPLVDALLADYGKGAFDVVIVDPAYKIQSGSENDADAIARFCAELDRLAEGIGCTVVYSHHHSKGGQGGKNAEDRASGSGVFARDADAIIDMIELSMDSDALMAEKMAHHHDAVPFRLEFVLRDFKRPEPRNIWFRYPVHEVDLTGTLAYCKLRRPGDSRGQQEGKGDAMLAEIEAALEQFMGSRDEVERKDFVRFVGKDSRTVSKYLERSEAFELESGVSSATIRRRKES